MYDVLRMGMWTEVSKPRRGAFLAQSEKFAKSYLSIFDLEIELPK